MLPKNDISKRWTNRLNVFFPIGDYICGVSKEKIIVWDKDSLGRLIKKKKNPKAWKSQTTICQTFLCRKEKAVTTFYLKYINTIKEESGVFFAAGSMPSPEAINRTVELVADQHTLKGNLSPSSHCFPTSLQHLPLKTFQRDSLKTSLTPEENKFSRNPE